MKITTIILSLVLAFYGNAQDITLKFEIKMQGIAQEMAAFAEMQGVNYFKNEKCRVELENMMFSMRSYIHSDGVTVCQSVMDEKKYYYCLFLLFFFEMSFLQTTQWEYLEEFEFGPIISRQASPLSVIFNPRHNRQIRPQFLLFLYCSYILTIEFAPRLLSTCFF